MGTFSNTCALQLTEQGHILHMQILIELDNMVEVGATFMCYPAGALSHAPAMHRVAGEHRPVSWPGEVCRARGLAARGVPQGAWV